MDDRPDPGHAWLGWLEAIGGWFVVGWLSLRQVGGIAWACRAPFAIILIGGSLIAYTDQARDIVIASAAPGAGTWDNVLLFFSILFWAGMAWYWARFTLSFKFALRSLFARLGGTGGWRTFWLRQMPRMIGALAILSVASAFWHARTAYREAGAHANADLFAVWFWIMIALAAAFYAVAMFRREILIALLGIKLDSEGKETRGSQQTSWRRHFLVEHEQFDRVREYANPVAWTVLVISLILSPLLTVAFAFDPVGAGAVFRSPVNSVLFGLGVMVPTVSFLVLLSARTRLPMFGLVALWMIVSPALIRDNHDVRKLEPVDVDARPHLIQAFKEWYRVNTDAKQTMASPIYSHGKPIVVPPFIVVATAGGASRAAYWTSQVLTEIEAREERFSDRVFLISGVSGGSLGAITFRSLVEANRRAADAKSARIENLPAVASSVLRADFLNAAMSAGLYVDLPLHAFPWFRLDDRAAALEKAWERAWINARSSRTNLGEPHHSSDFDWDCGFLEIFSAIPGPADKQARATCKPYAGGLYRPWPILALNGTSVEKGKRVITSNVRLQGREYPNAASDKQGRDGLSDRIARYDAFDIMQSDIRISTAGTMSARFPVISPTGGMRDRLTTLWTRVTDGGLYENFGALTADEVLRYVVERRREVEERPDRPDPDPTELVWPLVILISSDPSLDRLEFGKRGREITPDCPPVGRSLSARRLLTGDPTLIHPGNDRSECEADTNEYGRLLLDPLLSLYQGRVARGESAAVTLRGRVTENRVTIRNHLWRMSQRGLNANDAGDAEKIKLNHESIKSRLATSEPEDFFHFRQCKVPGFHSPTMSWHDSSNAWDVMDVMKGLSKEHGDPCGNRYEFIRLCVRLAVLTTTATDEAARTACEARWGIKSPAETPDKPPSPEKTAAPSKQP